MQIGLDAWLPTDNDYFQDLGVTWTKLCVIDVDAGLDEGFAAKVEGATNAGLKVIADMRPSGELHRQIGMYREKPKAGSTWKDLMKRLTDGVTANVARYKDVVSAWEWWGEYDCPHVGGLFPGKEANYPNTLERVYDAAHKAGAREVWNGGYGVNFQRQFADSLIADAPHSFDALNWHHYNISEYASQKDAKGDLVPGETLGKRVHWSSQLFADMFRSVREDMRAAGCCDRLVASEWGMPVVSDDVVAGARFCDLFSFVFEGGVYGLGDTEACAYLDGWMSTFAEAGMEVLVYHRLRDDKPHGNDFNGTFWGVYCGLLDLHDRPKLVYDVIKQWAQRALGKAGA